VVSIRDLRSIGFLFVVAFVGACNKDRAAGSPPAAPAGTEVVRAALNAGPRTSDFIFEASNSIVLHSAPLTVNGGDVGARGTGSGPFLSGGVPIDISSGAVVQSTHNVLADSIKLNTGASVGDIQTNHLLNPNAGPHGSVTPFVPLPALPAAAAVTPGTTNLTVAGGKTVTASPGQFLTVSLGTAAVLRLNAGTYQMKDLTVATSGRIEALGPVQILIANRLNVGSSFFIGPASGKTLTSKDIRIEVSGVNGTDGALGSKPKAAAFASDGNIEGLVLVPNGTLTLATGICAKGAFLAKDIDVGSSKYTFEDGFPNAGGGCTPASCDDHNPCTTDTCNPDGTCTHGNVLAGISCSDGNDCNGGETCDGSGTCQAGTPVVCKPSDQCHTAGTCDPMTGKCSNPVASNGTTCDDNNPCTKTDTCQAGTCTGSDPVICTALDQCHTAGACDQTTGSCSNPAKTDGTACDDSNACTQTDTCQAGACTGSNPVVCGVTDQCHMMGSCDIATGFCSNPAKPDGTACDDSNACTQTDTCEAGICAGSNSVKCTALDQCHDAGSCDVTTGVCSNPAKPNGAACNDNDLCTQTDTCQAGTCTGSNPVNCTALDQCHDKGACNSATGICTNVAKPNGTPCDDSNACTQTDTCQAGACTGSNPVTCVALDQCHDVGTCNSATGGCSNPAKPDGTACDDSNACTQTDTCQTGTCSGSNQVTCTAMNDCHEVGTCTPDSGQCSNPLKAAGSPCGSGGTCSADGQCVSGNQAPVVNAGPDQTIEFQQPKPSKNFTLQRISTPFNFPVGIEYHPILNKMVMSVNCCFGEPNNFEAINADGTHEPFSAIHGLGDEVYMAIARDDGGGHNLGGFVTGEMYVGTGAAGEIARVSPDGSHIDKSWVTLPGETGLLRGQLQFDRTGVFGGDLLVTATGGGLWRVTPAGNATLVARLPGAGSCEGLAAIPNDPGRYGPWAGKILVGDENSRELFAVDAAGNITTYDFGISYENITVIPAGENYFGVDYGDSVVVGASASQFKDMVGDILISDEFSGQIWHFNWNGVTFDRTQIGQTSVLEHTAFGPAAMAPIVQSNTQVALAGTASDDGQPPGSTLSTTWSVVSGPAPVTFTDSHSPTTTATFIDVGTYVLALTATDGTLSSTDTMTVTIRRITPNNDPPVVDAGPDQTIQIPEVTALAGSATDDGLPPDSAIALTWTQLSGPVPATIVNPQAGFTSVLFAVAGTYVFQLEASDGELTSSDTVTITVNPEPPLGGSTLSIALSDPGPMPLGAAEFATTVLLDASLTPIPHFPVKLTSTGANPFTDTIVSDDTGVAVFGFTGKYPGADHLHATAAGLYSSVDSPTVSVTWLDIPVGAPLLTQGWIKSPLHQSTLTDRTPITLSDNITLTEGTLSYWPWSHPDQVHTLPITLPAAPGATLGTFDTTVLANGSYIIDLSGMDDAGHQRESEVLIVVTGEYKPGRVVVELTDLTVPIANMPITIGRRYDSLEKDNVGDFGNGWSLAIGHPKLEVDGAKNVAITMPNGRRANFYFGPTFPVLNGGPVAIIIGFLLFPSYVPEPGIYGTLTSNGCPVLMLNPFTDGPPVCFGVLDPSELEYAPTEYTYTDPQGTAYVMGATGELRSITDRKGNSLTFTPSGIVSSAGKNVTFVRDPQGRITRVLYPAFFADVDASDYSYDASGNLTTVELAKVPFVFFRFWHHTYDGAHNLLTSVDPRGNTARVLAYGADGRLATDTDALGNITSYAYNLGTRTTTTTLPDNGITTQVLDDRGLVLSATDPLGHVTTHEYDANWNETKKTNALGEVTTATYDDGGNPTSMSDPTGTTHTTYNHLNLPATVTDRLGHVATIDYDDHLSAPTRFADELGTRFQFTLSDHGLPLTVEDADGHVAQIEYDAAGNRTSKKDWLGRVTHATYDEAGHKLSEISARSAVATYTYYLSGWPNETIDPSGYHTQNGYDENGNKTLEYDFQGIHGSTNYAYNALNQLTQVTKAIAGTTVSYTRDFRGNPLTMTDENGHTTRYDYDLVGNLIKTTFADGTFTTRSYDALDRLKTLTDERNNTTSYEYQSGCGCSDRVTKVTDPLGHARTTIYDANGRKSSETDANGHTTSFAYDVRGHVIQTTYPDGTSTQDAYDARGRRISTTDQTGATTLFGYDDQGQLTSVTDPLSNVTTYAYDLDGNVASVTDADGHTTTYDYDLLKRKTKRTLPLGQFETFTYDLAGRETAHLDFRGTTTTMTYDSRDRMLSKVPDARFAVASHAYVYSPTGMRTSATDATGTTTYTYDLRDRMLTKSAAAGTLTYTYDAAGNVASILSSNPNGTSVAYAWDAANQLASITDNRTGGTTMAAYTPTGRPTSLTQPNSVGLTYSYDSLDRVASMQWQQGPSPFASWAYTHNLRGQRAGATDITGRSAAYGYDAASRLISETITGAPGGNGALTYALDAVGNRLSRGSTLSALGDQSFSYNANDEISGSTFDDNGNTTAGDGHTFTYDFENHLISKDGGAITLAYNCDGHRVEKTVGGVTTQFLVDDLNPTGYLQVVEELVGGAVQTRYTYGTSLVSQTRDVSSAPGTSYYGYDAHGNITFLTNDTGSVTDTYDYDAFGNVVARSGSTPNTRLFAGEELDRDLGLVVLRARQYHPDRGRFVTADLAAGNLDRPISFHRYLYAGADPVNKIDPSGMSEAAEYAWFAYENLNEILGISPTAIFDTVFNKLNSAVHLDLVETFVEGSKEITHCELKYGRGLVGIGELIVCMLMHVADGF